MTSPKDWRQTDLSIELNLLFATISTSFKKKPISFTESIQQTVLRLRKLTIAGAPPADEAETFFDQYEEIRLIFKMGLPREVIEAKLSLLDKFLYLAHAKYLVENYIDEHWGARIFEEALENGALEPKWFDDLIDDGFEDWAKENAGEFKEVQDFIASEKNIDRYQYIVDWVLDYLHEKEHLAKLFDLLIN
jgi:hypothetical protein